MARPRLTPALAAFLFLPLVVAAQTVDPESVGRGGALPTESERALAQQYAATPVQVHLNNIGMRRVATEPRPAGSAPNSFLVRPVGKGLVTAEPRRSAIYLTPDAPAHDDYLPHAVDNSELPSFPPIIHQGKLNSCTAVCSTYYQLTHMVGLVRGWDQKRVSDSHRFSPTWTYNLTNDGANQGVYLLRCYLILLNHGAATLQSFPYLGSTDSAVNYRRWPESEGVWLSALRNRIRSFGTIREAAPEEFLRRVRELVVNGHVLTFATQVDGWNMRSIPRDPARPEGGRHQGEYICTKVNAKGGNHTMTIVGYDDDIWVDLNQNGRVDAGEKGALKIANSWGTRDWNKGFRWLHYSTLKAREPGQPVASTSSIWDNEAYWIQPRAYYEPAAVLATEFSPAMRNQVQFDVGMAASDRIVTAHNFVLSDNGGPFNFSGMARPTALFGIVDLTDASKQLQSDSAAVPFVDMPAGEAGRPVLTRARLIHAGGTAEMRRAGTAPDGRARYDTSVPLPMPKTGVPITLDAPATVNFSLGSPGSFAFSLGLGGRVPESVKLHAFSNRPDLVTQSDMVVERQPDGRCVLRFERQPTVRGSFLVTLCATDTWSDVETVVRVNFTDGVNRPPTIEAGEIAFEERGVALPFTLQDDHARPRQIVLYFDAPEINRIRRFKFEGKGRERVLKLEFFGSAPLALNVTAFDGELAHMLRFVVPSPSNVRVAAD